MRLRAIFFFREIIFCGDEGLLLSLKLDAGAKLIEVSSGAGLVLLDCIAEQSLVGVEQGLCVFNLRACGQSLQVGAADIEDDGLLRVGGGVGGGDLRNFRGAVLLPR
jgi:hypothetical protein